MNKHRIGALVAAAALTLTFAGTAFAAEDPWGGQGFPVKEDCTESDPGEALWIWTGESDGDAILHFDGNTYVGEKQGGGSSAYHFVTPYPTSEPTGAFVEYTPGEDGTLTISHGCPAETTTTTTEETTTTTEETTTEETTTEETTTEETTTEETTTEETTTDETTTDETTDETTTDETTSEETTPEGSVEELTPPSTDTIGQPTSSSSVSTGLLLVLAGILSAVLVVVPAAARNRR